MQFLLEMQEEFVIFNLTCTASFELFSVVITKYPLFSVNLQNLYPPTFSAIWAVIGLGAGNKSQNKNQSDYHDFCCF